MKLKRSIIRIIATSFFVCAMFLSTFSGNDGAVSLKRAAPLNTIASNFNGEKLFYVQQMTVYVKVILFKSVNNFTKNIKVFNSNEQ